MSINISIHGATSEFEKDCELSLTKSDNSSRNELVELLVKLLNNEESVNILKTSIKITDKSIEFIRLMIETNIIIFKLIDKDINEVIIDGVLDPVDLPSLILLVKDILNLNMATIKSNIKDLTIHDTIQFIKDLLLILIEEDYIFIYDKINIEKSISMYIELLSSTINVNININTTPVSLFSSIFSLSCCKVTPFSKYK
jgi:hypothetical protein